MEDCEKKILLRNRTILAKHLISDEVLQILIEKNVLTDIMVDTINSKPTQFQRNVELLTLLPKRGPTAFSAFVEALNLSEQSHLSEKLRPSMHLHNLATYNNSPTLRVAAHTFEQNHLHRSACETTTSTNSSNDPAFDPTSFSFITSSTNKQNTPMQSTFNRCVGTNRSSTSKPRVPTEHEDRAVVRHSEMNDCPVQPKRRHQGNDSSSIEYMDTVPSPCNSLDDIASDASVELLLSAALPTLPKQKFPVYKGSSASSFSTITASNYINSAQSLMNISGIDLADGPSVGDLIVRKGNYDFHERERLESYRMTSSPRGLALIISIERFEPAACLDDRLAGDVDRARLEFVLRQLGFKCYLLVDGTAAEILSVLQQFASLEDHHECDVGFIAVMSHGEDKCFFGRDGGKVFINQVIHLLSNTSCKGLRNKPKILAFQCCRGGSPDKGVDEIDGPTRENAKRIRPPDGDKMSRSSSVESISPNKLPTHSDTLIAYATVKGFAAMRNTRQGSWFIQALVRVLAYHSCDKDIAEMMTIVNNLVKGREGWSPSSEYHRCKEMSVFNSTLCKKLYFFPI